MFGSLCVLLFLSTLSLGYDDRKQATTWSRHTLVRPVVYHSRSKRNLSSTRQENGMHHDEVVVRIDIDGDPYELELRLNHDLLPEGHSISYQEGEKTVLHKPSTEEINFCQYSGHIRGKPNSRVALSTCFGLRGVLNDGTKIKYIEPVEGNGIKSLHYVYEDSGDKRGRCGQDQRMSGQDERTLVKDVMETKGNDTMLTRYKRDTFIQPPYHADESSRYVELVLVVDYGLYEDLNKDIWNLHHQLQEITNIENAMYSPLNVFIALTGVEVWTTGDRIKINTNIEETLRLFMEYRQKHLFRNLGPHDHAQLLSKTVFADDNLGLAYRGSMCSYELSCGVFHPAVYPWDLGVYGGTQLTFSTETLAKTALIMAHEMGHSFGMRHDNDDCTATKCQAEFCIMYYSYHPTTTWSECSVKALYDGFSKGSDTCLRNMPTSLFGYRSCGNGFVEPGEECDCGSTVDGYQTHACHKCCDPETCQFKPHAKCATGACCNLQTCQIKPKGIECRAAKDPHCDLPEACSGASEFCPEDVFVMDTTPCYTKAYCMQGQCRSHNAQCQMLWGSTGVNAHQECYDENTKGNYRSNCGYDMLKDEYKPCLSRDVLCGRLSCHHNGEIRIGDPQISFLDSTRIDTKYVDPGLQSIPTKIQLRRCSNEREKERGASFECHMARFDFGLGVEDPGLVPDGVACGDEQICYQQQCLPLDYLRRYIIPPLSQGCRAKCSGNGVCNSKGNCHCNEGFELPLCTAPNIPGARSGSSNPYGRNNTSPPRYPGDRDPKTTQAPTKPRPDVAIPGGRNNRRPGAYNPGEKNNTRPDTNNPGGRNNTWPGASNPSYRNNTRPGANNRGGKNNMRPVGRNDIRHGTNIPDSRNNTTDGTKNSVDTNLTIPEATHSNGANNTVSADKEKNDQHFKLVMYIIFFGVTPLTLLLIFICLKRRKSLRKSDFELGKRISNFTIAVRTSIVSLLSNNKQYNRSANTHAGCNTRLKNEPVQSIESSHETIDVDPNLTPNNSNFSDISDRKNIIKQEPVKKYSKDDIKFIHNDRIAEVSITDDISTLYSIPVKKQSDVKIKSVNVDLVQINDPLQKNPTESNYVNIPLTVKQNSECKMTDRKAFEKDKPIPNPKQTILQRINNNKKAFKPIKQSIDVISDDAIRQWPKLKPVNTSPTFAENNKAKNTIENASIEINKDVKSIKKYFEGENKINMNVKPDCYKPISTVIPQKHIENDTSIRTEKPRVKAMKDTIEYKTKQNVLRLDKANKPVLSSKPSKTIARQRSNVGDVNNEPNLEIPPLNVKPMANSKPTMLRLKTNAVKQNVDENVDIGQKEHRKLPITAKPLPKPKPAALRFE